MQVTSLGLTHQGFSIPVFRFGNESARRPLLIIGGVHGNEPEGVVAANALIGKLSESYLYSYQSFVIPCFNPEGYFAGSRLNSRGVDLNRNLPTNDWKVEAFNPKYPPGPHANSELENQYLTQFLAKIQPGFIISLHSFEKFMLNINGECGELARAIQVVNQYPIEESIGYPTPGCLGTYTGLERDMPTITYEIERSLGIDKILEVHLPSLLAGMAAYENLSKNVKEI